MPLLKQVKILQDIMMNLQMYVECISHKELGDKAVSLLRKAEIP